MGRGELGINMDRPTEGTQTVSIVTKRYKAAFLCVAAVKVLDMVSLRHMDIVFFIILFF